MMTLQLRMWLSLLAVAIVFQISNQPLGAQQVDFERDIAPILEDRCWYCHGEDSEESGLRLDNRSGMLRGGDSGFPAIIPGEPEKSYLIDVVSHQDPNLAMPPDEDPIPAEEIDLLTRWIKQGAVWPGQMEAVEDITSDHWSFQAVQRPPVPELRQEFPNPIDAFLQNRLNAEGLAYSDRAEPRSLIRRVSVVLTGLPPSPEEVDQFVEAWSVDPDQAYSELVDQLLESPHYGERWAQHWLDVIRWAETNGSEANLYRKNAWVYRDYVVRSFNDDKPYDQFVREQIAGDSLGVGEATGFLVAGPHVPAATVGREPAAIRQARADRMDEIMQTVGASVMGITIGCARCHNHKFDPFSIQDYYSMTAVFQDIEFGSRHPEYSPEHPLRQRGSELWSAIHEQRDQLRQIGGWEENWGAYRELHFRPIETTAIRIQFKTHNVNLDELEVLGPNGLNRNLASARRGTVVTGFPENGNEGRNPIDRVNDSEYGTMAWRASVDREGEERPWLQYEFAEAVTINRLRLSSNREYFYDTDYLQQKPNLPRYQFDVEVRKEDGTWQPWVGTWWVNTKLNETHPERQPVLDEIQRLINQLAEEGPRPSFVGRLIEPVETFVLLRGSPESPRDLVDPAGPDIFDGNLDLNSDSAGPQRRLAFAEWMTRSEHPLTARVMVNRLWYHVFGTGIVATTSDFGSAGALPSHPALLDWLAAELIDPTSSSGDPWSMKSMIRLMVMSEAFRQSSQPNDDGLEKDAGSTLFWRYPPRRVEAEVIRDAILLASGRLDLAIGGRSYRIHNEKKTYAQWEVVDNHGPDTWRRMIYQERMRRVDDRIFTAFDFPDCGQVRPRRPVSTTPLQALSLMNSEFVIEQSSLIADRAKELSGNDPQAAVEHCYRLILGRFPREDELQVCVEVASSEGLSIVCRALINSNEFVFLP